MEKGLSKKEVTDQFQKYGLNEIRDISKNTPFQIFIRQIRNNFIIYLLLIAASISLVVGEKTTGYVIFLVIVMVVCVGFSQEYHAEKSISALRKMIVPVSSVLRDGKGQKIESRFIVPGDIIFLHAGERIPADSIVIKSSELHVDESILTGESTEIEKRSVHEDNIPKNENLIFMGSYISRGTCTARVLRTGMNTKFGNIAALVSTSEKELPLQEKVNIIVRRMTFIGVIAAILIGSIMLIQAESITFPVVINILIVVIAISVSSFPEGFPVVLITTLAVGASKMAKQNAIVNRMSIIETLGETTVICTDKTGTITKGEMTVKKIYTADSIFFIEGSGYELRGDFLKNGRRIQPKTNNELHLFFTAACACNDASLLRVGDGLEFEKIGSATEIALLVAAGKAGMFSENLGYARLEEIPFNSERKFMAVLVSHNMEKIAYIKGAPEYILAKCSYVAKAGRVLKLSRQDREKLLTQNNSMASESLRTIGIAYRPVYRGTTIPSSNYIFLGFAGMEDAPRDKVKESIEMCRHAGIQVKMITGDNKETAIAIAKEIGLSGEVIEGEQLDTFSDNELADRIKSVGIFSRARPEHKLRIVRALKANREVVTMTGDGVNDAPALKEAHIGVAMGKNGTDVSRSVSDLILKDDNFNTIVIAIREGRTIFKNIRKFVAYQLSCNFAELAILFFSTLLAPKLGWQIPILVALQILFINLVTDDLPAITLGLNPSSKDAMKEPPRTNREILDKKALILILFTGFLIMFFVLFSYFFSFNVLGHDSEYSRTVAFFSLILLEIVSAFNFRSLRKKVFGRSILVNPQLFFASVISLFFTFLVVYTPLSLSFETTSLRIDGFLIATILSLLIILIFDFLKKINTKKRFFDFEHM